jgi:hypothetical protein
MQTVSISTQTMREAPATQQEPDGRIERAQSITELKGSLPFPYPALERVNKPNLTTAETAYYLNRRPQTLRGWACNSGSGPLVPKRIGGLLAWSTAEVKTLAGVEL